MSGLGRAEAFFNNKVDYKWGINEPIVKDKSAVERDKSREQTIKDTRYKLFNLNKETLSKMSCWKLNKILNYCETYNVASTYNVARYVLHKKKMEAEEQLRLREIELQLKEEEERQENLAKGKLRTGKSRPILKK